MGSNELKQAKRLFQTCIILSLMIINTVFFTVAWYTRELSLAAQPDVVKGFTIHNLYADHFEPNPYSSEVRLSSVHSGEGYVAVENKSDDRMVVNLSHETGDTLVYTAQPGITYCLLTEGKGNYDVLCGKPDENAELHSVVTTDAEEDHIYTYPSSYVMFTSDSSLVDLCSTFPEGERMYMDAVLKYLSEHGEYMTEGDRMEVWYVPDNEEFMQTFRGDCFDFASYVTAAFRMKGIPCRLVVGEADGKGHAWVEVKPSFTGRVAGYMMEKDKWCFLDPTALVQEDMTYTEVCMAIPRYMEKHQKTYFEDYAY